MRLNSKRFLEWAGCAVFILLVAWAALQPAIGGSLTPMALERPLFEPPWQEARPPGLTPPEDDYTWVHAMRYYPWYRHISTASQEGHSLLWNPHEAFGMPFMAQWRTRVYSPFTLPFYVMPLHLALCWSVYLKLAAAGLCAFFVGRRFGLHTPIACFLGVGYMLSAPVFGWSDSPVSDVTPWMPLLILAMERLISGQVRMWPLGALALALMGLGGEPSVFAGAIVFTGVAVLARCIRDWRGFLLGPAITGLALALAAGLTAVGMQLLPFLEFQRHAAPAEAAAAVPLSLGDLAMLLAPESLAGKGLERDPATLLHWGIPQLLLLTLWWAVRSHLPKPRRRRGESLFIASVLFALAPLVLGEAFWRTPGLRAVGVLGFLTPQAFVLAWMAAAAAEEWLMLNVEQTKSSLLRLVVGVPIFWGGLSMATLLLASGHEGATVLGVLGPLLLLGMALLCLLGFTAVRPNARTMGYGLTVLAIAAGLWGFGSRQPATPEAHVFPDTAFTESLKDLNARVGGSRALNDWPLAGNGISQVYNPSGVALSRYTAFKERLAEEPLLLRRCGAAGLLLTREDIQGRFAEVRPLLRIREVYPTGAILFDDLETQTRARVIYTGRNIGTFDPAELTPGAPPLVEGMTLPETGEEVPPLAATVEPGPGPGQVRVRVPDTPIGVLVLADAWYPGWVARVNGVPRQVYPIDGVFRGVELGEGPQDVVFSYEPDSVRIGGYLGFIGWAAILAGFGILWWRTPRRTEESLY